MATERAPAAWIRAATTRIASDPGRVVAESFRRISPHEPTAIAAPLITADAAYMIAQTPVVLTTAFEPAIAIAVELARTPSSIARESGSRRRCRLVGVLVSSVVATVRMLIASCGRGYVRRGLPLAGECPPRPACWRPVAAE